MLKNIPDYIIIGAHKIEITSAIKEDFRKIFEDDALGDETMGIYIHENNKIHLWAKLLGTRKAATLLHEIIEAINWQNDLELTHTQLSTLTESLLAVLLQNDLDFKKIIQD
jgi:hypothetical protein